jgi:hypothetical protein
MFLFRETEKTCESQQYSIPGLEACIAFWGHRVKTGSPVRRYVMEPFFAVNYIIEFPGLGALDINLSQISPLSGVAVLSRHAT